MSNQGKTGLSMKSKDWNNFLLRLAFASGCTLCNCNVGTVKANISNQQVGQGRFTPKNISSADLVTSTEQPISNNDFGKTASEEKLTTNHTFKNYKEKLPVSQPEKCQDTVLFSSNSPSVGNTPVKEINGNDDASIPNQYLTNAKCSYLSTKAKQTQRLSVFQNKIAQNQEQSPPPEKPPTPPENPPSPEASPTQVPPPPQNAEKDPPPLENQPTDFPATSPEEVEQKLDSLQDKRSKQIERLLQLLKKNREEQEESSSSELGIIRVRKVEDPTPLEQKLPTITEKPAADFKPVGYLLGRVSYFHTSNIFSSRNKPEDDGLIFTGLTLAALPFRVSPKTFLNGSIDGNIIRYSGNSEFDYNQIRFNLSVYQQLTKRMYGEFGWNNQQLFYAKNSSRFNFASGDKFLNENSFRLSLGRRDLLTPKLKLDSFYELRLSLTNPPEKRNRINNYVRLSLNYSLQQSLRLGADYQFNLSNFLQRSREDQYHRLSGNLRYRMSDFSSLSLQSGYTLGGSTDRNIDFDGWFFSVNYSWDLGQF